MKSCALCVLLSWQQDLYWGSTTHQKQTPALLTLNGLRSGQGKREKSGKFRKRFPVTRKSRNIDYSPVVRESQGSKKFLGRK